MALSNKGNFIINGIEFKPSQLRTDYDSLQASDTGRTDDGVLHINWVWHTIRKVEIQMPPMSTADASRILSLVQGKEYNLTYFDTLTNSERTIYVYTSNSAGDFYSGVVRNGLVQGLAFNAIELAGE